MKRFYVLLLLLGLFAVVYADKVVNNSTTVNLAVVSTGDTAQVSLLHTFTAVDSFNYIDTFSYQSDTSAHQTITWLSPLQIMVVTPTVDVATTYNCSVSFDGGTLGISKDYTSGVATLAALIDTLVDLINNKAGLSDSVVAQDSVTYIKLVSKFSGRTFTNRWTMVFSVSGGAGTLDTVAHVSLTTLAMISDSMPTLINADAGLDSFMTAANSGDTAYTITSDDPGVLFYATTVNHADTGGTLVASQANVTSVSRTTDTISIDNFAKGGSHVNSMYGIFVIEPSYITTQGIGLSDSVYIRIYTDFWGEYFLLAQDSAASFPCTVRVAIPEAAGTDTLFKEHLNIIWTVMDTATDTTATVPYKLKWQYNLVKQ